MVNEVCQRFGAFLPAECVYFIGFSKKSEILRRGGRPDCLATGALRRGGVGLDGE